MWISLELHKEIVPFHIPPAKQMYLSYSITAHSLLYINCSFSVPIRLCWNSKWIWCIHLNDSANHRLPSCLMIREPQSHLIDLLKVSNCMTSLERGCTFCLNNVKVLLIVVCFHLTCLWKLLRYFTSLLYLYSISHVLQLQCIYSFLVHILL